MSARTLDGRNQPTTQDRTGGYKSAYDARLIREAKELSTAFGGEDVAIVNDSDGQWRGHICLDGMGCPIPLFWITAHTV